jgi:uncharacterized membrane protein YbaN (DUF454 family)
MGYRRLIYLIFYLLNIIFFLQSNKRQIICLMASTEWSNFTAQPDSEQFRPESAWTHGEKVQNSGFITSHLSFLWDFLRFEVMNPEFLNIFPVSSWWVFLNIQKVEKNEKLFQSNYRSRFLIQQKDKRFLIHLKINSLTENLRISLKKLARELFESTRTFCLNNPQYLLRCFRMRISKKPRQVC